MAIDVKENLKKLGTKFNEASPAKKAGIIGAGLGAVVIGLPIHHFIIAGAAIGGGSAAATKAIQKKLKAPKQ